MVLSKNLWQEMWLNWKGPQIISSAPDNHGKSTNRYEDNK